MLKKIIMLLMIMAVMVTGCSKAAHVNGNEAENKQNVTEEAEAPVGELAEALAEEILDPKESIDLTLKPNEAGKIMVLMYHNIGDEEKEWVRTPANFRKDLLTLYEKGYRPISLHDYVTGNITTPEGCTPFVLTFDDGNKNNFEYLDDGTIKPDSAVGILLDFNQKYPDFQLAATFFLTGDGPFGQKGTEAEKIKFLLDNGMDIGNHSRTHVNFTKISKDDLEKEIGAQAQYLETLITGRAYAIDTIALPYGTRPKDKSLTSSLQAGNFNGADYQNVAILNVGWTPSPSPYDSSFDFASIPRIRASEMKVDNVGMYNYLEYFDNHPEEKFISDGVVEIVTVPEDKLELLNKDTKKEIYPYPGYKKEEESN